MAAQFFVNGCHPSSSPQAFDVESDSYKCNMKLGLNFTDACNADDDDGCSVCSTNIFSQTPTLESLPVEELLNSDDLEEDLVTNDNLLDDKVARRNERITKAIFGKSDELQAATCRIFTTGAASLLDSSFSLAIADAQLEGCPLIGCSTGFTSLCGHEMADILGFNLRFLVDPVLSWEQVNRATYRPCREFCLAAKEGKQYRMQAHESHDEWLPECRSANELIAVQTNVHKDGSHFNSMFLLRIVTLGDFDEDRNYIIAVQSEIPGTRSDSTRLCRHLQELDRSMAEVEKILGQEFIVSGTMHRQLATGDDDSDL